MKFCEKLQKLRKEKGYSQEELADLLDVSRQSVSKWESGTTYPEMDKLLSLCKIFNVSLDDLTNDEISCDTINAKRQNNFSNLVYAILEMINKSIEMFKNMNKKEIVKCITELIILFIILLIFKAPFNYLNESIRNIFINFSDDTFNLLNSIWLFLSNTIYLVLFITIFTYVYKTRYLDKFNITESAYEKKDQVNNLDEEDDKNECNKNTNQYRKEKHPFIFFDVLGSIINIFIKVCLFFIAIPVVFSFVGLVIACALSLGLNFIKIHYIGFFITLLGCVLVCFVIMEVIIRALFSSTIAFKRMFIMFTGGLVITGIGVSIAVAEIYNTKYIDDVPHDIVLSNYETTVEMQDDLMIMPYYNNQVKYVVDNDLNEELMISIDYYRDYLETKAEVQDNYILIHNYSSYHNGLNVWNLVKSNLQDKVFYNYNKLSQLDITITSSEENIKKLKDNLQNHYDKREIGKYDYYLNQIEILENENYQKEEKINNLETKIDELETKLESIQDAMN